MPATSKVASLEKFIQETYYKDPIAAVRMVNKKYRIIKIRKSWWRGYHKIKDAKVVVGSEEATTSSTTNPNWKLVPAKMREEFQNLEANVNVVIKLYCVTQRQKDAAESLILGDGMYAIEEEQWPRVREKLAHMQAVWSRTADKWCTNDGHVLLRSYLKDQMGAADFNKAEALIPEPQDMRAKFGLHYYEIPVRVIEDAGLAPELQENRFRTVAELLSAAVRTPRLEAAEEWAGLIQQLVETVTDADGNQVVRSRQAPVDGVVRKKAWSRTVRGQSLVNSREISDALSRCGKAIDESLDHYRSMIAAELPNNATDAKKVAAQINADDGVALRIGKLMLEAYNVAVDEAAMCEAVAASFKTA